ncbi:MAG: thioredoxin domain-containing protein [Anaeromyxobacter sp.]
MRPSSLPALALALVAASCGATAGTVSRDAPPVPPPAAAPPPATPEEALPGVDLAGLSAYAKQSLASWASETFVACGLPLTVSGALRTHKSCKHAPRMVALARGMAAKGATGPEIKKLVDAYYAGFDRRAAFDLTNMGEPLGDPKARITLVVVSDFTCPFCKITVPAVEAFAKEHAAEVRLFAKPFPIASHPGAQEAAEAGEWARDAGIYWEVQKRLYELDEVPNPDNLAAVIEASGGDGADLKEALAQGKYKGRVAAAQGEGRRANLAHTPSLYMNGRLVDDLSAEGLRFALDDEREWVAHGGWLKD